MQPSVRNTYLETEVLTATPQKLQCMLLEAAIRALERTRQHWRAGDFDQGCETLIKAQQVVAEILGGMDREANPELVRKVAGIYLFIYRSLVDAGLHRDEKKLDDAQRVLEEERETWRQLCEKMAGTQAPSPQPAASAPHQSAPQSPKSFHLLSGADYSSGAPAGFSIEA
jgi:flagellar protein FliS